VIFHKSYIELSVVEIFSQSFRLYLICLKSLFIPFLIANIICAVLRSFTSQLIPIFNPPEGSVEEIISWMINYMFIVIGLSALLFVIRWVIAAIVNGLAVKYSSDILEKGQINFKEGVDLVFSRLPSLLAAGLVTGILIASGFILFIIPGIIVAIIFSVAVQAIINERLGVFESLRRSRRLVDHRWKKTFEILFLIGLVIVMMDVIGGSVGDFIDISFYPLGEIFTAIIMSLSQPLMPIALNSLYYSLRTKEKVLTQPMQFELKGLTTIRPNFCYLCGARVPPDAIFCPQCGKRLKTSNNY
jgi:ribosomal protein L40E